MERISPAEQAPSEGFSAPFQLELVTASAASQAIEAAPRLSRSERIEVQSRALETRAPELETSAAGPG